MVQRGDIPKGMSFYNFRVPGNWKRTLTAVDAVIPLGDSPAWWSSSLAVAPLVRAVIVVSQVESLVLVLSCQSFRPMGKGQRYNSVNGRVSQQSKL
jgi:hypothetical protein